MKSWLAYLALLVPAAAGSATIKHEALGKGVELIVISGDIAAGDEQEFKRLAVQYDTAVVALDSPGGQLLPAIEIGKAIHLREFGTLVTGNGSCASACALIWIAGAHRFLTPGAMVGFHASYLEANGARTESGVANALVGRYLTQLELPERAIIFATSASPDSIKWLKASDEATSGITFELLSDDHQPVERPEIITTTDAPPGSSQSFSAAAGGWRVGDVSSAGVVDFVNTDEILRDQTTVQFWKDAWWPAATHGVDRAVELIRADCRTKGYQSLARKYYSGERFIDEDTAAEELNYAAPDSHIAAMIDAVCQGAYLSGRVDSRAEEAARLRATP